MPLPRLAALLAISGSMLLAAAPADARGRLAGFRGPNGNGVVAGRKVDRQPGHVEVRRGFLTENGRGRERTRSTSWGDGRIDNSVAKQYADGSSVSRDGSIVRNPDGSVSHRSDRTGREGNSQSRWSTIYRSDGHYSRSRGASTSSGRGYEADRDIRVGEDSITVERSLTTNGGRSASSSRTFQRPRQ